MKRLLAAALALLLAACAALAPKLEMPTLRVESVLPEQLGLARQRFAVTLEAANPNDRAVTLEALELDLRSAGEVLAHAASDTPVTLPARGRAHLDLQAAMGTAQWLAVLHRLKPADFTEGLPYTVEGRARLAGWGWVPFRKSGRWSPLGSVPAQPAAR